MKKHFPVWPLLAVALAIGNAPGVAARGRILDESAVIGRADAPAAPDRQQLRADMRKLWTDHVVWTREYIVAAIDDAPDTSAAAGRLMKNQEDIGNAIAAFYGRPAGDGLTALLKQHILVAVDVVAAAKAGRQAALVEASERWKNNADDIAAFLSKANPIWPRSTLSEMMAMHLETTTREVVARLSKKWDEDIAAFDEVYKHILAMSDALADGIAAQFARATPRPGPSASR